MLQEKNDFVWVMLFFNCFKPSPEENCGLHAIALSFHIEKQEKNGLLHVAIIFQFSNKIKINDLVSIFESRVVWLLVISVASYCHERDSKNLTHSSAIDFRYIKNGGIPSIHISNNPMQACFWNCRPNNNWWWVERYRRNVIG